MLFFRCCASCRAFALLWWSKWSAAGTSRRDAGAFQTHCARAAPVAGVRALTNGSSIPAGGSKKVDRHLLDERASGKSPQDVSCCHRLGKRRSRYFRVKLPRMPHCSPKQLAMTPSASTTSKPAFPYIFSNSYQTCDLKDPTAVCTISGKLYKDQVSLAGIGPVEVQLGSISKQTTNFDQFAEIGGVMGFTGGGSENVFFAARCGEKVRQRVGDVHEQGFQIEWNNHYWWC